jgi:hypothetical protein
MGDPAIVTVYDLLTKWFSEQDIEVESLLGWRALEKRVTQPRLVFEPGDRDSYGEFTTETMNATAEWGQFWTALTIYVQAPAPVNDERAQVVNTTRLLHAAMIGLQSTIGLINLQFVSTSWLIDDKRQANTAVALTVKVRDIIESDAPRYVAKLVEGELAVGFRTAAAEQHVPVKP